jgi:AraC-like DNA-binding protein
LQPRFYVRLLIVDVFQDHLSRARASGGAFAKSVACPPWGLCLAGTIQLAIHAVVKGSAWLWLDDADAAVELRPGAVALVRGGPDHHIAHEPGAVCDDHDSFGEHHANDDPDDPRTSVFLCGAYQFVGDVTPALIDSLPQILILEAAAEDALHDSVAALSHELGTDSPGQQIVLDRLLDVILVLTIRAGLRQSHAAPGWYHALGDPRLKAALEAIHHDPAHQWTVPELAAISGVSRATFARIFPAVLGQTPMQYLTDWRMALARDLLLAGRATLHQIAARTGYQSPYAFAAAFRRHHGVPPGRWRQHRAAVSPRVSNRALGN